jgi:hypothetical protein
VVVHPPFRWQREYARGFEKGLAAMAAETDVIFAVENMYPLRAGGSEMVPYAPHWDPTARRPARHAGPVAHRRLGLGRHGHGRRARRPPGPRAPGRRHRRPAGPVPDEHLVPGRGSQPCAELLGHLLATGYQGAVVVEVKTTRAPTKEVRIADLAESLAFARRTWPCREPGQPGLSPRSRLAKPTHPISPLESHYSYPSSDRLSFSWWIRA